jgi:hypothetical protein
VALAVVTAVVPAALAAMLHVHPVMLDVVLEGAVLEGVVLEGAVLEGAVPAAHSAAARPESRMR